MIKSLALAAAAITLSSCATVATDPFPPTGQTPTGSRSLEILASFLAGTFESIEQQPGSGDSTRVRLRQARLWPERAGEFWFYAEYERLGEEGRPYRQRIYRVGEAGGKLMAVTYRFPGDPKAYIGAWKDPKPFAGVVPGQLEERKGCRIHWNMEFSIFTGGTAGEACPGETPAIRYERSEFFLSSSSLRTWDMGFDANGKQVAGSNGPLEMRRLATVPR